MKRDPLKVAKGHAAVPNKHWEIRYNLCEPSENMIVTEGADFVAKRPTERKTTYKKVNETDT